MSVIDQGTRVTRTAHRCAYCGRRIPIATSVRWWAWTDGGSAGTAYAHPDCDEMYQELRRSAGWDDCELPDEDDFREECRRRWPGRVFPWTEPAP